MNEHHPSVSHVSPLQLKGKKGIVLGVANHRSIAWAITKQLRQYGAEVGVTVLDERAEKKAQKLMDEHYSSQSFIQQCDVQKNEDIRALVDKVSSRWQTLDFIVHSLAFAHLEDLQQDLSACSKDGYQTAMEVSAYSLLAIIHACRPLLSTHASIVTLSYLGAEIAIPSYGMMGPVKAALEAQVKYLAAELGPQGTRVNVVSAGPLKTLAASAIPGFRQSLKKMSETTPLKRGITHEEVAQTVCFLCSPMSSGITGETIHVDAGRHAVREI